MNSNTLKSQIETLKKQQGGMSQDLSQIGSSVTIGRYLVYHLRFAHV